MHVFFCVGAALLYIYINVLFKANEKEIMTSYSNNAASNLRLEIDSDIDTIIQKKVDIPQAYFEKASNELVDKLKTLKEKYLYEIKTREEWQKIKPTLDIDMGFWIDTALNDAKYAPKPNKAKRIDTKDDDDDDDEENEDIESNKDRTTTTKIKRTRYSTLCLESETARYNIEFFDDTARSWTEIVKTRLRVIVPIRKTFCTICTIPPNLAISSWLKLSDYNLCTCDSNQTTYESEQDMIQDVVAQQPTNEYVFNLDTKTRVPLESSIPFITTPATATTTTNFYCVPSLSMLRLFFFVGHHFNRPCRIQFDTICKFRKGESIIMDPIKPKNPNHLATLFLVANANFKTLNHKLGYLNFSGSIQGMLVYTATPNNSVTKRIDFGKVEMGSCVFLSFLVMKTDKAQEHLVVYAPLSYSFSIGGPCNFYELDDEIFSRRYAWYSKIFSLDDQMTEFKQNFAFQKKCVANDADPKLLTQTILDNRFRHKRVSFFFTNLYRDQGTTVSPDQLIDKDKEIYSILSSDSNVASLSITRARIETARDKDIQVMKSDDDDDDDDEEYNMDSSDVADYCDFVDANDLDNDYNDKMYNIKFYLPNDFYAKEPDAK